MEAVLMERFARVIGTGQYIPEIEVTNDEIAARVDKEKPGLGAVVYKFEQNSGIRRRFYAPREWATSDLAVRAAQAALHDAGLKPEDIDLIILGTDSPDYITPATSVVVQHKLGAANAGTYDVGCACASFPTAMSAGAGHLATNKWMKNVLVIGAYMMSKLADPADLMSFFYGDGAGAAVLTVGDKPGFITSSFLADGLYYKAWGVYSGGTAEPATCESIEAGRTTVRLVDKYPAEVNHEGWPKLARMLAQRGGFTLDEVDQFVFTQVNQGSVGIVMEALGQPVAKAHCIMGDVGYTGSACIPMALDDAMKKGKIKPCDLVVLIGSGVGYNQAGVAFRM
jgi:3-oxoacyl-[acyl-carrier-protein] synthase-3